MGCASGTVKYILITVNILWGLVGVLFIVAGGCTISKFPTFIICLLFIIGAVCLVCSIIGCCGICRENVPMTIAYAILILADLSLQIYCHIFSLKIEGLRKYADKDVEKLWKNEVEKPGAMDDLQKLFKCCGKKNYTDYTKIGRELPKSCYHGRHVIVTKLFQTGCLDKLETEYVNVGNRLGSGTYATIAISAIIFAFAIFLIIRFRRKQREREYILNLRL